MTGTSAAASVIAGMVTLVNARLLAAGYSTVGFLNPALYGYYDTIGVNDVLGGHNKCVTADTTTRLVTCCTHGFNGAAGWDPVTGFGSLNYTTFSDKMMRLASAVGTSYRPTAVPSRAPIAPSASPTSAPIKTPVAAPSRAPTRSPTYRPSARPTYVPSKVPSAVPTCRPTRAPTTIKPTILPTGQPTRQPAGRPTSRPTCIPTMRPSCQPTRQPSR
jgi:hypothetical protein